MPGGKSCLFALLILIAGMGMGARSGYIRSTPSPSCKDIFESMLVSVQQIKTLRFKLQANERINGKLKQSESLVKLNRSPRKIYLNLNGQEVLWIEGKNNGNALVNPAGFPYMNLNLSPTGRMMRENAHHTIFEIGFEYFADLVQNSVTLTNENFSSYFTCNGDILWNNHECYYITINYPNFRFVDYTVKKGEDLVSIARKLRVSEYMLLEANKPNVNNYQDVKPNQVIKVSNLYGNKIILYIDKNLLLPRVIKVYDDKGLFEAYEYRDIELNPKFSDEEFTKEYKGYGF